MASLDDEEETVTDVVSDYYFCRGKDEPLSFTELPVQWDERESSEDNTSQIFLRGSFDDGLQKLYMQVKGWKYDIMKEKLEISVLSKDNNWIKLKNPRKSFENEIRTILITVHSLHFCKRKPQASRKALWDHLSKVFSLYDVRPSENDLIDHLNFIREAVKRDKTLAKSKFLASFLDKKPRRRKAFDEDAKATMKPSFIVDDMNGEYGDDDCTTGEETEDCESDDEDDMYDSVCAICDDGGDLTCCDGICLRSFHATVESGKKTDSGCGSLGLRAEQVEGQSFICLNCRYKQHQCFVCGELGSSDKSSGPEVFCCSSATCGHFYHPKCVAKLLHAKCDAEAQDLHEQIAAGEPFTCPAHKCYKCQQAENAKVEGLQFAICRRCPRSYHRKCLPRKIVFHKEDNDEDVKPRAWGDVLPESRALIYCLKHEIDEECDTPVSNLKFPENGHSKKQPLESLRSKKKVAVSKKDVKSDHTYEKRPFSRSQERFEKSSSAVRLVDSSRKRVTMSPGPEFVKKQRITTTSNKPSKRSLSTKVNSPKLDDGQPSLRSRLYECRLYEYTTNGNEASTSKKDCTSGDEDEQSPTVNPPGIENGSLPPIDSDSAQRILTWMKETASSITLDKMKSYHIGKLPFTHQKFSKVDKSVILARVESSVEAVHLAFKKLDEGCCVEDAMAICEPRVLEQLMKWKDKLEEYLAPFLLGMRYTSFGRHFTEVEKLEKIVDRLRWYVEDGDMIVDFGCGANDFSCLLKERLDEMGKKCSYKNYDFFRPKTDFNFEKKDWMSVLPKELSPGSQLIMGLNPPSGKDASLANKFIEKVLKFKPKLLVLTLPPEAKRLDHEKRRTPYDLVWEDAQMLAGKSFYIPGSVGISDKQMDQWNDTPPPLYLWSRPDWTSKHKAIAQQQGHVSKVQEVLVSDEKAPALDLSVENHELYGEAPMSLDNFPVAERDTNQTTEKAAGSESRNRNKSSGLDNNGTGTKKKLVGRERDIEITKKKSNNDISVMEGCKEKHSPSPPGQSETPHSDTNEATEKAAGSVSRSRNKSSGRDSNGTGTKEELVGGERSKENSKNKPSNDVLVIEGNKEKHSQSLRCQSETPHSDTNQTAKTPHSDTEQTTEKAAGSVGRSRNTSSGRDSNGTGTKKNLVDGERCIENLKRKKLSSDVMVMEGREERDFPSLPDKSETRCSDMREEKHPSPRPRQSQASETRCSDTDFGKDVNKSLGQPMYKPSSTRTNKILLMGGENSIENLKKKPTNDILVVEGHKEKHSTSLADQSETPHLDIDQTTERAAVGVSGSGNKSSGRDSNGTGTKEKLVGGERSIENLKRKKPSNDVVVMEGRKGKHPAPLPHQSQASKTPCSDMVRGKDVNKSLDQSMFKPSSTGTKEKLVGGERSTENLKTKLPSSDILVMKGYKEKHSPSLPCQSETPHSDNDQTTEKAADIVSRSWYKSSGRDSNDGTETKETSVGGERSIENSKKKNLIIDELAMVGHKEKHSPSLPGQSRTPQSGVQDWHKEKHPSPHSQQSRASETCSTGIKATLVGENMKKRKPGNDVLVMEKRSQSPAGETPHSDMLLGGKDKHPSPLHHQSRASLDASKPAIGQATHCDLATEDPCVYGGDYRKRRVDPGYGREKTQGHSYNRRAYNEEIDSSSSQRSGYGPADSSSHTTRVTERYAPRLDELNHHRPRMNSRLSTNFSGFAPGLYQPLLHHNSSGGWLNE